MSISEKPASLKVYFVRHGETDWNAQGRMQGQQNIPLNATGRFQAERAGRVLSRLVPQPELLDYLVSPMLRTLETSEIMLRTIGLDPEICRKEPRLKELTFGRWEGMTWKEVRAVDPEMAAQREKDKWGLIPPGGGESYAMLAERIRPVFEKLERDTVMISHGGVARAVLAVMGGVSKNEAPGMDIWQGRILVISDGRYQWV